MLANLLDVPDSNFDKLIDIKDNFLDAVGDYKNNPSSIDTSLFKLNYIDINYDKINVPIYSIDSFVRRCSSLQLTNISSSELVNK